MSISYSELFVRGMGEGLHDCGHFIATYVLPRLLRPDHCDYVTKFGAAMSHCLAQEETLEACWHANNTVYEPIVKEMASAPPTAIVFGAVLAAIFIVYVLTTTAATLLFLLQHVVLFYYVVARGTILAIRDLLCSRRLRAPPPQPHLPQPNVGRPAG